MCGIAGIIDLRRSNDANFNTLETLLRIQHHRGPDATATWSDGYIYLGHNRLSIIDLSDAANQPMHYKQFSLIFNGEVYNYIELKKELEIAGHVFTTTSDSEVIVHAYAQWGHEAVNRFIGMWAFVVYDNQKKELFASRDRFGIKPFYYIFESGRFYFASEIKTLKHSPLFSTNINLNQVSRGLQMGWLGYRDETYFTCVKSLPEASNLVLKGDNIEISRYWNLETGKYLEMSFEEKRSEFYRLFADSIKIHLRSDVPVGSCLSGGLDSSSIVSMVQNLNPGMNYNAFSIYYEGEGDVDERPFIREVINKFPEIIPYYLSPTNQQVEECFHHAMYHCEVPVSGSSFISQYFLMKLIAQHGVKVVLDGQGADEYLAGYMHSFYRLIAGMIKNFNIAGAIGETFKINRRLGNNTAKIASHFAKSLLATTLGEQKLYALEYARYYPFMTGIPTHPVPFNLEDIQGSRLDQFLYHLIFTTSLPTLLHYEDRNSMAFSIESRVPFLDHRLVEFCFTLYDNEKIRHTDTKFILREALKGILPEAIYQRKDKKGFVTPGENKWLRGPLKFLIDSDRSMPEFINKEKAKKVFTEYLKGDNSKATLVWRLAVLREWAK